MEAGEPAVCREVTEEHISSVASEQQWCPVCLRHSKGTGETDNCDRMKGVERGGEVRGV